MITGKLSAICAGWKRATIILGVTKNQIYFGSGQFIEEVQCKMSPEQSLQDIPKLQKQALPKPLKYYEITFSDRKIAMANAYPSGHYTLQEVGKYFGVS